MPTSVSPAVITYTDELTSIPRRDPPQGVDDTGSLVWLHGEQGEPSLVLKAGRGCLSQVLHIRPFHLCWS